jgi:hypothetical protein
MKKISLFILIVIFNITGFSQDTLYTKEGKVIAGKVTEVTQNEIKYKSASNPDGPVYVINKSDIVLIEYKNGTKDVFQNSSTSTADNSNQNNSSNNPTYTSRRPNFNIIVGTIPYLAWGGWAYRRPYYGYSSGYRHHWNYGNYGHHNNYGHYGKRGR